MFGDFKDALEPDTDVEDEVFGALEKFIRDATPGNKAKASKLIAKLKAVKKHYPNDLDPVADVAYRGTQLRKQTYREIAKQYANGKNKWVTIDYDYKPRSEIQSWTTNRRIAQDFALHANNNPGDTNYDHYNYPCPAIIQTSVNDDFIMNSKLTNMIAIKQHGLPEHEIIRISNNPAKAKLLIHRNWLQEFLRQVEEDSD